MTPRVWPPVLNWKGSEHWDYDAAEMGDPGSCVLCGAPSLLLSDDGRPCHKVCAERWFEQHPEAWAAYEERRDRKKSTTAPAVPEGTGAANTLFTQAA
jgi:hypothetical protein